MPPSIGAWRTAGGTEFRVWAPATSVVELVVDGPRMAGPRCLDTLAGGMFGGVYDDVGTGARYRYLLDGRGPFPDPASRFQPDGVHGPSTVVDPDAFVWTDQQWAGPASGNHAIYELHVGTFTPAGTFAGVEERLPYLRDLGVTAVELMPVADFPGRRNWGYDGVALFAPARCYGEPDALRRLVDRAHQLGLAVLLDVVYNHVGPDGAYLNAFSPYYFSDRHTSPWGAGVNLDGEHSVHVREFFIENAMHWVREYHIDGLRLDATHAMRDDSPRHFLTELAERVRVSAGDRHVLLIAEDHRNLAKMVRPEGDGGWGLDGVWADDLHHQLRRCLAGDSDGYYGDFSGTTDDIALTMRQGWFFTGQYSEYLHEPRGTDPSPVSPHQCVVCLQNHDQVGNRALGERLHHQIDLAAFRAASALLLTAPETPLIFMGQEWGAGAPFLYFTDHNQELGALVRDGRRAEFGRFEAFANEAARDLIPDPQDEATFAASRLDWTELAREPHAATARLHAALLALRIHEAGMRREHGVRVEALDRDTIAIVRESAVSAWLVVARLRGGGAVTADTLGKLLEPRTWKWRCHLTTEDPSYVPEPQPVVVDVSGPVPSIRFARPSAVVFAVEDAASGREGSRTP